LTDPPSIFGPFVADHGEIFEMYDAMLSYATADAARQDYLLHDSGPGRELRELHDDLGPDRRRSRRVERDTAEPEPVAGRV